MFSNQRKEREVRRESGTRQNFSDTLDIHVRLFCVFVFLFFALLAALFCVAVVAIGVTAALRVGIWAHKFLESHFFREEGGRIGSLITHFTCK